MWSDLGYCFQGHLPISALPSFYRTVRNSFIIVAECLCVSFLFFKTPSVFTISIMVAAVRVSASGIGYWNLVRGCMHMWVIFHLEVKIKTVCPRGQQTMACEPNLTHQLFFYVPWAKNGFYILKWLDRKDDLVTCENDVKFKFRAS